MAENKEYGFATKQLHAARPEPVGYAPVATPIYQTSAFIFESTEQGAARFKGEEDGYIYTRLGNPNANETAARIAELEGAEAGLLAASGMGAIASTVWTLLKAGDHVVTDIALYACTHELFGDGLRKFGVDVTFMDLTDIEAFKKALRKETKLVYFETTTNPELKIADIDAIAEIAHSYNPEIQVMVDNTFASPYLVRPLKHGADIVVHSVTKYLNGHGDVIAGVVCGTQELIKAIIPTGMKYMTGACIGPFDAFLINRGLKTMDIRMDRHCANAMKIAQFLEAHPAVKAVRYPGLASHPYHETAKKLYEHGGFGGMITFDLDCDRARTAKFVDGLKVITLAVSLGDSYSLIEHPASMTHSPYPPEELAKMGIGESMLRFSVGLENVEDLIADLKQGLDEIEAEKQ